MPHVTEEVWSFMPGERGLLAVAEWPTVQPSRFDVDAENQLGKVVEAVTGVRRYREEASVRPSALLPAAIRTTAIADDTFGLIARLARLQLTDDGGDPVAEVPVPGGAVSLLPSDDLDPAAAEQRIAARREQFGGEIRRLEAKLANERFVE